MNRSHEHIEGLLSRRAESGSLSEGFRERVAQGVSRAEPGAMPAGNPVMPVAVKGAISTAAVAVIGVAVWLAVLAEPGPGVDPASSNNTALVENTVGPEDSVLDLFKTISGMAAKKAGSNTDLYTEGQRLFADVLRVGEAFASVFPAQWKSLIWKPSSTGSTPPPAEVAPSPALHG